MSAFRTGDRVLVISIQQFGIVRGHKDQRVLVHFGTQNMVEAWAWYAAADLERAG